MSGTETDAVRERYERRKTIIERNRYSPLNSDVLGGIQERQRVMIRLFSEIGWNGLDNVKVIEVGCGTGSNILELLRLGFAPENLIGIELLEDRAAEASRRLPVGIVRIGDAAEANILEASQDIVFQSTVFSSLLDDGFQKRLAERMWGWVKPGGGVLWYDFIYNNPKNTDVRGVPIKRVRELFPDGRFTIRRVTLAPPIARRVCRIHPCLYSLFNAFPFLRTHILCWIGKPTKA